MLFISLFATLDINAIGVTVEEGLLKKWEFIYIDQQGEGKDILLTQASYPPSCNYATIFQYILYTMVLEKQLKPFHLCVKRYFATLY